MDFNIHLSMDYYDKTYGGGRLYADMLEQAVLADRLGYRSVSVSEHHLLELGLMPAPLMAAVKIAAHTRHVDILTAVVVLPLHDMRVFAGEVVVADIFTDGRLILGVGRGAYAYEMERMGVPMAETRERFDESLDVLQALLTREDVSWAGKHYNFDALTVMPRPVRPGGPPMAMAVLHPDAIYHCAKRGFHIITNPLTGDFAHVRSQVDAFRRAKDELGEAGSDLTLSVSRTAFVTRSAAHRRAKLEQAQNHYMRFDNVFTGPGIVEGGIARALPRKQTIDELGANVLLCSPAEMVDRLAPFAELGVNRVSLTINFGASQSETLDTIQSIAEEVMPHFAKAPMVKTGARVTVAA
jgi:alkanesulfonate monooxygenase SsuD/methylene tetrahydromethanopterin reductase-like flavin-dependent oxidoreductase (luciferase family)